MDSQDNIVLTIIRFESKRTLLIPIPEKPNKNILFSINEYDTAEISNSSNKYDIYIENLDDGGEIKLSYGEITSINDIDQPNPPMDYRIRLFNKVTGKSDLYLYKINHASSTSDSQYKEMIKAIGCYDENLLYEKDTMFLSGKRVINSAYKSLYTLFRIISLNKSHILNSLDSIFVNPLLKDKRIVTRTNDLKKQSSRSIIKNSRSHSEDIIYSSQVIQYADFGLNEYLVHILRFSNTQLESLVQTAHIELEKTNNKLNKLLANISSDPAKRKKHTNYQLDTFNKRIAVINEFLESSRAICYGVERVLSSDTFQNVEPSQKRDNSIVFHHHYLNIERKLYLPLFQGFAFRLSGNYSSILTSPIKQTSKLFEAYCLLTIDASISELGFESVEEEIDYDHFVKHFVRDDYEFELSYSIDAKDVSVVKQGEFYYINSETRHISPDFYLVLKKNDMPICFVLFDAKCRKPEYVNKDILNGKYENTIRDYLSLRYSVDENPFFLPKIVDSLWLLFPEDNSDLLFDKKNQLEYKFVKLSLNGDENSFIETFDDYISMYLD